MSNVNEHIQKLLKEISNILSDYRLIINNNIRPEKLSQKRNLYILEKKCLKILDKSRNLIKPIQKIDENSKKNADQSSLELEQINKTIEKIQSEIIHRKNVFESTIIQNKSSFNKSINIIESDFIKFVEIEKNKNEIIIKKIQNEIDRLKSSFNNRLTIEVSRVIEQKELITKQISRLNNEYINMKTIFEQKLKLTDSKVEELNNELQIMESLNLSNISNLENEYEIIIKENKLKYENEIEKYEKRNLELKNSIQDDESNHEKQTKILRDQIIELNHINEINSNSKIIDRQQNLEKQYQLKIEEFNKIEDELHNFKEEKFLDHQNQKKNLKFERDTLINDVNTMNKIFEEKLKTAKKESEINLYNKEADLKHQTNENKKAIDNIKQRYSKELLEHKKKLSQSISDLEQKLIQTVNQIDASHKQLEYEVNTLIREKTKMEQDFRKLINPNIDNILKNLKLQLSLNNISISSNNNFNFLTYHSINDLFYKKDQNSIENQIQLRNKKQINENEFLDFKNKNLSIINEKKKIKDNLLDDIRILKIRLDSTENRYQSTLNSDKISQKMAESAFKNKLNIQKDAIRQLKEELQKIQTDENKIPQLIIIQNQHKNEINNLEEKIENFEDNLQKDLNILIKSLEIEYNNEKNKSFDLFKKSILRLEDIYKDLLINFKNLEIESIKENSKWMELRKDISEITVKFLNNSNSPPKTPINYNRPLPNLKR